MKHFLHLYYFPEHLPIYKTKLLKVSRSKQLTGTHSVTPQNNNNPLIIPMIIFLFLMKHFVTMPHHHPSYFSQQLTRDICFSWNILRTFPPYYPVQNFPAVISQKACVSHETFNTLRPSGISKLLLSILFNLYNSPRSSIWKSNSTYPQVIHRKVLYVR